MAIRSTPPSAWSASTAASVTRLSVSHKMLPASERTCRARWGMPKPGRLSASRSPSVPIRRSYDSASSSCVVQCWPLQPTYWRSSLQIGQASGGTSDSANWVPQVAQMNRDPCCVVVF